MTFQTADWISLSIFVLFSVFMFALSWRGLSLSSQGKKWKILFLAILAIFTLAALSGVVAKQFFPFGPFLFSLIFLFALIFSLGNSGQTLAKDLPFSVLIGFQLFRLPLEIILHHWSGLGTVPETMTWTGSNWDIFAGIVAFLSIFIVKNSWKFAIVANSICFLLLMNVVRVVVMSSPLPFSWNLDRPLLLVAYFPYCLIGPLFVMPALIGHIVTYRKIYHYYRS